MISSGFMQFFTVNKTNYIKSSACSSEKLFFNKFSCINSSTYWRSYWFVKLANRKYHSHIKNMSQIKHIFCVQSQQIVFFHVIITNSLLFPEIIENYIYLENLVSSG